MLHVVQHHICWQYAHNVLETPWNAALKLNSSWVLWFWDTECTQILKHPISKQTCSLKHMVHTLAFMISGRYIIHTVSMNILHIHRLARTHIYPVTWCQGCHPSGSAHRVWRPTVYWNRKGFATCCRSALPPQFLSSTDRLSHVTGDVSDR